MFKVRSIENKAEQESLCASCCTEYIKNSFAYGAYDVTTADDESGDPIAVCQFSFIGECKLHTLSAAKGREDDEAVLILGFAVLEFLRRCGFTEVIADIPEAYAKRLGFVLTDGTMFLDLKKGHACGGH